MKPSFRAISLRLSPLLLSNIVKSLAFAMESDQGSEALATMAKIDCSVLKALTYRSRLQESLPLEGFGRLR